MWASRSKPKKALDLHPTAGILLQSLVFFPQRCRDRLLQPPASSGIVLRSSAKRYPTDGQAIPPPLDTCCYSPQTTAPRRNRTSYNPSPPLNLRLHCRVFPSLSRSRPGPRRRPPPRCVCCGMVNKRESSEEDCTWRA